MADNNYYEYYDEEIPMASSSMGQEAQPSTYKPTSILNALKHTNDVYQGLVKAKLRMDMAGLDNPVGRAVMPGAYYAGTKLITDDNYTWDDAARESLPLYDTYYDGEDMSPEKVHQLGQEAALWFVPGPGKGRKKVKRPADLPEWGKAKHDQYKKLEGTYAATAKESHPGLRKKAELEGQLRGDKTLYDLYKSDYDDAIANGYKDLADKAESYMLDKAKSILDAENELNRLSIEFLGESSVGPDYKYRNELFTKPHNDRVYMQGEWLDRRARYIFKKLVDEYGEDKARKYWSQMKNDPRFTESVLNYWID